MSRSDCPAVPADGRASPTRLVPGKSENHVCRIDDVGEFRRLREKRIAREVSRWEHHGLERVR